MYDRRRIRELIDQYGKHGDALHLLEGALADGSNALLHVKLQSRIVTL